MCGGDGVPLLLLRADLFAERRNVPLELVNLLALTDKPALVLPPAPPPPYPHTGADLTVERHTADAGDSARHCGGGGGVFHDDDPVEYQPEERGVLCIAFRYVRGEADDAGYRRKPDGGPDVRHPVKTDERRLSAFLLFQERDPALSLGAVFDDEEPRVFSERGFDRRPVTLRGVHGVGHRDVARRLPRWGRRKIPDPLRESLPRFDEPFQEVHPGGLPPQIILQLRFAAADLLYPAGEILPARLGLIVLHLRFRELPPQGAILRGELRDDAVKTRDVLLVCSDLFLRPRGAPIQAFHPAVPPVLLRLPLRHALHEAERPVVERPEPRPRGIEPRLAFGERRLPVCQHSCGGGFALAKLRERFFEREILLLQPRHRAAQVFLFLLEPGGIPLQRLHPLRRNRVALLHAVHRFPLKADIPLGLRQAFFRFQHPVPQRLQPGFLTRKIDVDPRTVVVQRPEPLLDRRGAPKELGVFAFHQVDLQRTEPRLHLVELFGAPCLPLQRGDRFLHFRNDIVDANEVVLDALQFPVRRFSPVLVLRDPGRLFEEPAPFVGLVGEDRLDHLQLDHRVGVGPHPCVHEKIEDVLQPARDLVQEVFALAGPVHAPPDRHLRVFGREYPLCVLDDKGGFGHPERLARLGPVEDHVFHLVAAQRAVPLFAENPPDRVDDVCLPAPVRAHDCGNAAVEGKVHPVGKGLESDNLEF